MEVAGTCTGPAFALHDHMIANWSPPRLHRWWIVSGIGLAAGCTDTAPPARLDDAPFTCAPDAHDYRFTAIDPAVASADKIDLDDNGTLDDALGHGHVVIAALAPAFAVAPRFGARLAGDVPWVMSVERCGDAARVTIDRGATLGDGTTELFVPRVLPRAVGAVRGASLSAHDGMARVPVAALADPLDLTQSASSGWLAGDGLAIAATFRDDGSLDGVLAVGLPSADARAAIAPPLAAFLSAQPASSPLRTGADADHDGTVTAEEVEASDMFQHITSGDVTILAPDGIPRSDALSTSIAFAFHAQRIR